MGPTQGVFRKPVWGDKQIKFYYVQLEFSFTYAII